VTDIAALRKSYELAELDESASHDDPLRQFAGWLEQAIAAELPEPNAMTLATVGADGRPSTRIVLIKGYDERGIVWFTNYQSRKGRELAANPAAALRSTGSSSSAWSGSRAASTRSRRRNPTRTTPPGRSIRASAPGRRRRAR
jgi:pyridoxine/pyridoxamine 5'-phosphate oxidase